MGSVDDNDRCQAIAEKRSRLLRLEEDFIEPLGIELHPWRNMWMGLVGALYSLEYARHLVREERRFDAVVAGAKEWLSPGTGSFDPKLAGPWLVGFWLNSAELRISAILHQVLQVLYASQCVKASCLAANEAFTTSRGAHSRELAERFVKRRCPCCGDSLQVPNEAVRVLEEFSRKRDALWSVHHSTNQLKHDDTPELDSLPAAQRWDTDITALAHLVAIFSCSNSLGRAAGT